MTVLAHASDFRPFDTFTVDVIVVGGGSLANGERPFTSVMVTTSDPSLPFDSYAHWTDSIVTLAPSVLSMDSMDV